MIFPYLSSNLFLSAGLVRSYSSTVPSFKRIVAFVSVISKSLEIVARLTSCTAESSLAFFAGSGGRGGVGGGGITSPYCFSKDAFSSGLFKSYFSTLPSFKRTVAFLLLTSIIFTLSGISIGRGGVGGMGGSAGGGGGGNSPYLSV